MIERVKEAAVRWFDGVWEPTIFRLRTTNPTEGFVCRRVLGSKMYLDVNDRGISRELITRGKREVWGTEVLRGLFKPGQTVVDIGGNIGYYVLFQARNVGPTGHVYALEPVPKNYALLRRNLELNGCTNVSTFPFAVGGRNGEVDMHLSHFSNWHSMSPVNPNGQVIKVRQVTLDDFMRDKPAPNIVRMDVEGYEVEILQGMNETLARSRDLTLYIELHPHIIGPAKMRSFLEHLASHGFDVLRISRRRGEFRMTIAEMLRDEGVLSGKNGGYLAFFSRPR